MKLSIDLGGTNIRIAQVENGSCIALKSVPCLANEASDVVLGQLFQLIDEMYNDQVDGIGVGVPSIVDNKGVVYNVANIASWQKIELKSILEDKYHLPVKVTNDCNCFVLGESTFGKGKNYSNIVGVTIGTGIGAGIVIDHHIYSGAYTGAGEIGELPYLEQNYEAYCSSSFFTKYGTTGRELSERAARGDADALQLWSEFGEHMGALMKAILFAYAPQAIILGGGIVPSFSLFKTSMEEAMQDFPYPIILEQLKIFVSEDPHISLLGASALFNNNR